MYAPNDIDGRIQLWDWMSQSLSIAEQMIGEVFNMVEWDGDWIVGHASTLGPEKEGISDTL